MMEQSPRFGAGIIESAFRERNLELARRFGMSELDLQRYAIPSNVKGDEGVQLLASLSKEELISIIVDDAKNWLAHDGLWFQAVEKRYGIEVAIDADIEAWRSFTVIEAKRIMERLGLQPGGGIPALVQCLQHRFYARLNLQDVIEQ